MAPVPQSVLRALHLEDIDPSQASLETSGLGSGFSTTGHIRVKSKNERETTRDYFLKTSPDGKEMFEGEFASLNAIADIVPGFCPRALACGALDEQDSGKGWFLVTEFLDLTRQSSGKKSSSSSSSRMSLVQRLAKLHSTPAPAMKQTRKRGNEEEANEEEKEAKFGFPVPTYCGNTRQPNHFCDSWADFYANERLLMILSECERNNGPDSELQELVTKTAETVVPRLLGDDHLGYDRKGAGKGIVPVVVHGDLWSGNAGRGRIVDRAKDSSGSSMQAEEEEEEEKIADVVYDPSACYADNEYELGIMHMFGGFRKSFFDKYHALVPKTEPVEEYDDRLKLYELYHHLNHHAIFGGGYKSGAISIMKALLRKYGHV